MKEFEVITKEHCPKCTMLKKWLNSNNIEWTEMKIEDQTVVDKLIVDPNFIQTFCDIEGCTIYTPIIHMPDEDKYYFKELFGIDGLREHFIKKIIGANV